MASSSSLVISLSVAQDIIIRYVEVAVFILGMIGSALNMIFFSRRRLRSNSCCIYFFASSVTTIVLLCMGIIPLIYALYNKPNPFFSNNIFCKTRAYFNQWGAMLCRWLLVTACIDRCIACSDNTNVRRCFSIRVARRITLSVFLIWTILPMHVLIFANIVSPGNIGCVVNPYSVAVYHGIYTIVLGGGLPPIIMLICTALIWKSLRNANERLFIHRRNTRDQQVLLMLLAQVLIFFISTIPFMANTLYGALTRNITNKSADRRAIEGFAQVITELFVYIFPASSFYSSTLASRTFRNELMIMFKSITNGCHLSRTRISPVIATRIHLGINIQAIKVTTTIQQQNSHRLDASANS